MRLKSKVEGQGLCVCFELFSVGFFVVAFVVVFFLSRKSKKIKGVGRMPKRLEYYFTSIRNRNFDNFGRV